MPDNMVQALRNTAAKLSIQPHTTGIEEAFRVLADELDVLNRNLDPTPFILTPQEKRVHREAREFYKQGDLRFDPREGYEQEEDKYG